jgi:outer membrane lipoprotein carrier protein
VTRVAPLRLLALLTGLAACLPASAAPIAGAASIATEDSPQIAATLEGAPVADAPIRTAAADDPAPVATVAPPAPPVATAAAVVPATTPAATPATGACPAPAEIARKLQARYDETRAFRAEFEQETYVVALGERDQARGTVAFSKPGRMRWDFTEPTEQQIVSDGATLWIYQPAERQVLQAAFQAAFVSTTPVSFLAGVGRITDDFVAEPATHPCTAARAYVQLAPKVEQGLGGLELTVDRATYDIVEAAVTDPIGNVTTLRFLDMQRNVEIPAAAFTFTVPPGVDVIMAPGSAPPL